jgi:hypothetical protein
MSRKRWARKLVRRWRERFARNPPKPEREREWRPREEKPRG